MMIEYSGFRKIVMSKWFGRFILAELLIVAVLTVFVILS